MRGIFIRIYLAFMVTSLVATLVTLLLAMYYRQWSNDSVNLIAPTGGYISAAELILQRGGEPLLLEWLLTFERHPSVNAYVFDDQGISLLPHVPADVLEYAFASDSYQARVSPLGQTEILVKAPLQSHDGRVYLLVVEFLHPLAVFNLPAYLGWGFLASLLLFAIWGFVLSRYMAQPLLSLQRSVRAFADGRWPVRIAPALLRRRDEIGELGREFGQMAERLQRLISDQRQLLRDVSHELRSPLARTAVALELARLDAVPEQQEYLDRIELETRRLDELIEDLLGMARLETLQDHRHWQTVDCAALLQEVVADARFERPQNRLQLNLPAAAARVQGDARLLLSAVENIIRNALLHTAEATSVDIDLSCSHGCVQISVRDHGPGVPEHLLADLLRPFVRSEQARERSPESLGSGHRGFGLGLAIADRVVRHHRGELQLRNHEQGGLMVTIRLPLEGADDD
ncbi:MAG: ATP-binding protein [Saccharospirillaceae bacterium]|nr:ATP-binding protein [Saccharospirillaceae bacterium]MCD8529906.1 ATP-binding protein [Saccharospirillaceae bacterium]